MNIFVEPEILSSEDGTKRLISFKSKIDGIEIVYQIDGSEKKTYNGNVIIVEESCREIRYQGRCVNGIMTKVFTARLNGTEECLFSENQETECTQKDNNDSTEAQRLDPAPVDNADMGTNDSAETPNPEPQTEEQDPSSPCQSAVESPKTLEQPTGKKLNIDRIRVFISKDKVLGISYQGDGHIKNNVPCQDCHSFTKINDVWSVAVVSDGAGSKAHSDIGSNAVCAAFPYYISTLLTKDKRFKNGDIPDEKTWDIEFRTILNQFQADIKKKFVNKSATFDSYSATIIVLVFSDKGYMVAHVGDGRAGVKVNGEWKSIITPHKGEEANQTIFSTTIEFANKPGLKMSGIYVPETHVSAEPIEAFALMSDGCENGAWATYQRVNLPDGDFRIEDVNQPRAQTLDMVLSFLNITDEERRKQELINFITTYKEMVREGDDKTILVGIQ